MTVGAQIWTPVDGRAEFRVALAALVSFALHLGLFLFLTGQSDHRIAPHKSNDISLDVREITRPPPPPPLKMESRKVERVVARIEKPPPRTLPPPPNQTPPKGVQPPKAPPPIRIGVNLESTVSGGEFAAPVGNTMYGQAAPVAPAPAEVKPYWAARYVPQSRVSEMPVLLEEIKAPYPSAAKKEGIEGQVILMMTIDYLGKVAEVRTVSGPGHGLNEAAEKAARLFRFKPAKSNGVAVTTTIRYTYSFEID